jgi:hypothetical protein
MEVVAPLVGSFEYLWIYWHSLKLLVLRKYCADLEVAEKTPFLAAFATQICLIQWDRSTVVFSDILPPAG